MDWQQIGSLVIVAVAAGALLWGRLRRRKFSFEHDTHCGCGTGGRSSTPGSIIFRVRKGERPQILVKAR